MSGLEDHAGMAPPPRLDALMHWAAAAGWRADDDRSNLHPLVVPLARRDQHVLGLLRWPTPDAGTATPVVRTDGWQVTLVGPSVDAVLHRALATADAEDRWDDALASHTDALYLRGTLAASRLPLAGYLMMRVGVDHGFFEERIAAHEARGDIDAALVTADRLMQDTHGFARAGAIRAWTLARARRLEEAADAARLTLLQPAWTLGEPFAPIARLAGWTDPITSWGFRRLADDDSRPPADRAAHRMDQVAVDRGPWEAIRLELASLYEEAGLSDLADWING